ncbi:MAG: endonuclease VIII, partial [Clostridiales bacterium]|nr:endonuclease VIII [Clostridiales bacterium]
RGEFDNAYWRGSRSAVSPLDPAFDEAMFGSLWERTKKKETLSAKAFLATEQRIPGLGNGVLQDILFAARVSPRTKISDLPDGGLKTMYDAVRQVLSDMTERGGRDTERDLLGNPGGYQTVLSKRTLAKPCPVCGGEVRKEAYLGGSVYYCPTCQK